MINFKKYLLIETSLKRLMLILNDGTEVYSEGLDAERGLESVMSIYLEKLLKKADASFLEINLILVSTGPGSFTGIRVGLSAAKILGLSLDVPVLGYTNLDALYSEAIVKKNSKKDIISYIHASSNLYYIKKYFNDKIDHIPEIVSKETLLKYSNNKFIIGNEEIKIGNKLFTYSLPSKKALAHNAGLIIRQHKSKKNGHFYNGGPDPLYIKDHYAKLANN